jgi:hypothetical protein
VQPAFWRTLFGDTLDLGMLPLSLADTSYPPCTPAAVCQELLVLTALGPAEERTGSIGLEIARARIDLTFGMKPDVRRYVIPLSRLWPGVAARAAGLSLDVVATDGFTVERRVVGRPPGRLY